ncbi:MAG: hypothetical protein ABIO55_16905 [Ginsengibacter sp.]
MKRTLLSVIIIMPVTLLIITGHRSKERPYKNLTAEIDSVIKIQTNLQIQTLLQYDSIEKHKSVSSDPLFIERVKQLKNNLLKQERQVDYLRKRIMIDETAD